MIDPQKIGDVVGAKGKVINQIIDETGVKIDITDDGAVAVCGLEKENIDKAIEMIQMIHPFNGPYYCGRRQIYKFKS